MKTRQTSKLILWLSLEKVPVTFTSDTWSEIVFISVAMWLKLLFLVFSLGPRNKKGKCILSKESVFCFQLKANIFMWHSCFLQRDFSKIGKMCNKFSWCCDKAYTDHQGHAVPDRLAKYFPFFQHYQISCSLSPQKQGTYLWKHTQALQRSWTSN